MGVYERLVDRVDGHGQLSRAGSLQHFLKAHDLQQEVGNQLDSLNKGYVLKALLTGLPTVTALVSVVGGLYTVYSSTDCEGSKFSGWSRAFLYTSIAYTITNTLMSTAMSQAIRPLIQRPNLAFGLYCLQAGVLASFFAVMVCLLVMVVKTACPSVKTKVKDRLT